MKAVFRHELSSYFTNLTGYVFGAFLLLFAGIFTMVYNLKSALTNFEYVLGNMSFVFLVIVPILTMRVGRGTPAENRSAFILLASDHDKSRTGQVCRHADDAFAPSRDCLPVSAHPLQLRPCVSAASFSAIAGFFFLGAALLAIGMFISSVTDSQAVAAGLCFVAMLLNYYISSLASYVSTSSFASFAAFTILILVLAVIIRLMTKSSFAALVVGIVLEAALLLWYLFHSSGFEGLFAQVMQELSLFDRFYQFVDGVFDVTSIVYFITVIGFFLFLSVQSMEKRRWSE